MRISIDRSRPIPIYMQIRNQVREQILRGDLAPATRLPSERKMARRLGVSRSTIVNAYGELAAEGLVEPWVGRGTIVTQSTAAFASGRSEMQVIAWQAHFSQTGERLQHSTASELMTLQRLSAQPGMIPFSLALPDPSLVSVERLRQAWEEVLQRMGTQLISYAPIEGLQPLRELIADRLIHPDIRADHRNVVITNGFQQAFDLLLRILTEPGDTIIAESPTYFGALQACQAHGVRVIGVPTDAHGMMVDQVEFLIARYRPRLIYTVPTYQNPTAVTMSLERRGQLLRLAQRHQVPIIEDDPFSDLYFHAPPPPPLKALDTYGHVIYLGTFSKNMGPGWRVGYLIAAQPLLRMFLRLRRASDPRSSTASQLMVMVFAERGWLLEQTESMRNAFAMRCRTLSASLKRFMPSGAHWREPEGGFYLWLELPEGISASELLHESGKSGVLFVPGHLMYPSDPRKDACRLSFSAVSRSTIRKGVKALAAAIRELQNQEEQERPEEMVPGPIV